MGPTQLAAVDATERVPAMASPKPKAFLTQCIMINFKKNTGKTERGFHFDYPVCFARVQSTAGLETEGLAVKKVPSSGVCPTTSKVVTG